MTSATETAESIRELSPGKDGGKSLEISVIVPSHNGLPYVRYMIQSLLVPPLPEKFEIIVVDNRSEDGTGKRIAEEFNNGEPVRVVYAMGGIGPAYARNVGVRCSSGEILLFCDDDDIVAPGWIIEMAEFITAGHPLAGSKIDTTLLDPFPSQWARASVGAGDIHEFLGVPVVPSSGLGTTRAVWEDLNGMDESFMAGEDLDFCIRASEMLGLRPALAPVFYYRRPRSRLVDFISQQRAYGRAKQELLKRHTSSLSAPRRTGVSTTRRLLATVGALRQPTSRRIWLRQLFTQLGRIEQALTKKHI